MITEQTYLNKICTVIKQQNIFPWWVNFYQINRNIDADTHSGQ
jgi:hypothetical protein